MKLNQLTLTSALAGVQAKKFSAQEVWQACHDEILAKNPEWNVYLHTRDDFDVATPKGPLAGLPLAIKDNFCQKGSPTTASSNVLRPFVPPYNATVVQRLTDAGASFLGKVNMDAWAHGSSTVTSDFGFTRNPRNPEHFPGGSSGGSAAAVAGDLCLAALGSETAGSIRQPGAWCGCVGIRPSYGRASRYGVAAMASSLDSPGFLTKTVADNALLLPLICGLDQRDATTSPETFPNLNAYTGIAPNNSSAAASSKTPLRGKTIGFAYLDLPGLSDDIRAIYQNTWQELEQLGATVKAIKLRVPRHAMGINSLEQGRLVSCNLGRYDGFR